MHFVEARMNNQRRLRQSETVTRMRPSLCAFKGRMYRSKHLVLQYIVPHTCQNPQDPIIAERKQSANVTHKKEGICAKSK